MSRPIQSSAIAMLTAVVVFVAAVVWGAVFAFPQPDASPEKAAQLQQHAQASGWVMFGAILLFLVALCRLLWSWRRARRGSAS
jgi:protein-S-isoprenylcysteine O-methyltransferase Ste14